MARDPNTSTVINWDDRGTGPVTVRTHVSAVVTVMEQVSVPVGEQMTNVIPMLAATSPCNMALAMAMAVTYTPAMAMAVTYTS